MNILVALIYFILTITWSLAYGCGQQQNRRDTKCRQIDDNFDGHGDAAVQRGAHCPMDHIQGFTRSHWMPPSCECLRRIAPTTAMVNEIGIKHTKHWSDPRTIFVFALHKRLFVFVQAMICLCAVPEINFVRWHKRGS